MARPNDGILLNDHYQFTMAQLYHRVGLAELPSQFEYFFRAYPDYGGHQAGYCVTAGLVPLLEWMEAVRVGRHELEVLGALRSGSGAALFDRSFLDWLAAVGGYGPATLRAVPEGRIVHANTPVAVVEAPLAVGQLLETPLLNHMNYPTLVATKASRVVEAARGGTVFEFGLRRAPAAGANDATRAAIIGGASSSSNVGMSYEIGVPSAGTHGHSMVQVFMAAGGGELEAFRSYAEVYPDDCLLLVDTINTLESGVPNAIRVFEDLRRRGHEPVGIRLDSGDLAHLAVRSAALLDGAGFDQTKIVLSSGLDELTIWQIQNQIAVEAPRYGVDADALIGRLVYGVGSKLATSHGDPSLDGVYKLVAVGDGADGWTPALKISDTPEKIQTPGAKQVWRVYDRRGLATADVLALSDETLDERPLRLHHPRQPGVVRTLDADHVTRVEPLLEVVFDSGATRVEDAGVDTARARRRDDLGSLDAGVRRLVNPHRYHVSLTTRLVELRRSLVAGYLSG